MPANSRWDLNSGFKGLRMNKDDLKFAGWEHY